MILLAPASKDLLTVVDNPEPCSTNKTLHNLSSSSSSSNNEIYSRSRDTSQTIIPDIDIDNDHSSGVWEEYDTSKFGPDVVVTGAPSSSALANTGPQAGPSNSISESHAGNRQSTPLFDTENEIEFLTSSQRSFSYLNINHSREDPYRADVDIGLELDF